MNIRYIPAQEVDIDVIYTLCKENIERYETDPIPMEKVLPWCRRKIENQFADYRAILADDEKAGYFHLSLCEDGRLELDDLYLLPDYRGKGIGTEVLRYAVAQAKAQNTKVFLYVFRKNEGAVRLYQREGFVQTDTAGGSRLILEHPCK